MASRSMWFATNCGGAMAVNEVILTGHAGGDCELRFTPNGTAFASFRLAHDEVQAGGEKPATTLWVTVVLWGEEAEAAAPRISSGDYVKVRGALRGRAWTDKKTNAEQYRLELKAEHVKVYPRRDAAEHRPASGQTPAAHAQRYDDRRRANQQRQARPGPAGDENTPFE